MNGTLMHGLELAGFLITLTIGVGFHAWAGLVIALSLADRFSLTTPRIIRGGVALAWIGGAILVQVIVEMAYGTSGQIAYTVGDSLGIVSLWFLLSGLILLVTAPISVTDEEPHSDTTATASTTP